MAERTVDVLVPVAVDSPYTYRIPDDLVLDPGDLVAVPLGVRRVIGCVWPSRGSEAPLARLKSVSAKLDLPALPLDLVRLIDWVADYTLAPRGMVLRMALRFDAEGGPGRPRVGVRLGGTRPARLTPARKKVLATLADGFARPKADAAREAGVSPSVIEGLVDEGVLIAEELAPEPIAQLPDPLHAMPTLTPAQEQAASALRAAVAARAFSVHLVDGVTGSGKTEVYFEAVAEALRAGRQALILLPEIALTARFLDRFAARFGVRPGEWHSAVPTRRRARLWEAVASGEAKVVAGARSALYLPFRDLGLIVIDEEHDPAYKQEDGVHYHARDMAVVRGLIARVPVVLASATPSIESEVNARRGRYQRLALPERFGGSAVPPLEAIDLRREGPPRGRFVAPRLEADIGETIARGEQALLFLNRRGYAPLTLCRACGHRMRCPNCDAWLVEHRFRKRLVCHHCGFAAPPPPACPKCAATDSFVACGPGVERLQEEVQTLFPDARTLVLSSDLAGGVERLRAELEAVTNGDIDVVIGTQLVAKGHHFPGLALVGVVDADLGLGHGDPRAAERTFQLLHQVVGRAGRVAAGRGLLQTYQPEHPVMAALILGDREAFYSREIEEREQAALPPFGRLAAIVISAPTGPAAEGHARALAAAAPTAEGVRILGPAEAPLALIRGRHRWRLLARSPRSFDLSHYLREWLGRSPTAKGGVRVTVDVDPQSFL
ncbi:MAG TPA: primosomal protein N' [Xanthobacteraceae bacterium]|nr:primosomal protein N' [Xanthobacteraceae bacterium]